MAFDQTGKKREAFLQSFEQVQEDLALAILLAAIPADDPTTLEVPFLAEDFDDPEALWDNASEGVQKILFDATINVLKANSEFFESAAAESSALVVQFETIPDVVAPPLVSDSDIPETLYHGTQRSALYSILSQGLLPMGRRFVYMNDTRDKAEKTALRHGSDVVILKVDAKGLVEAGFSVERKDYGHGDVFASTNVPNDFVSVDDGKTAVPTVVKAVSSCSCGDPNCGR
jgi:hypothetical protein